jgi:guanyl-specific ribonuclease Sa
MLGAALMALAIMLYLRPLQDSTANSGVLQILNMIVGALIGAFGAATQQLLKASGDTVTVSNDPTEPVPVTTTQPTAPVAPVLATGELPPEDKLP